MPDDLIHASLIDGVWTCDCGSTEFQYEEQVLAIRRGITQRDGVLIIDGSIDEYGDGDDDPGLTCAQCAMSLGSHVPFEWD